MSETNTTKLYRVENPNIPTKPNGVTSHEKIVGQWFSSDLMYALNYLPKATQTFGRDTRVVDGAQLIVAEVPTDQLDDFDATTHPIAADMDIEPGNYILPRTGVIPMTVLPLDETLSDLRGGLNRWDRLSEAKRRIVGSVAVQ